MQLAAQKEALVRKRFEEEFGSDPKLWDEFKRHVQFQAQGVYRTTPVSVRKFFTDPYYCSTTVAGTLFPEVLKALEECGSGQYIEAVLTGGIGVSKTTIADLGTLYQLYVLSCMYNPQRAFGLMETDEILIIFQSITGELAASVSFPRFRELLDGSPYFKAKFKYRPNSTSILYFPNRVIVKPVSGSDKAAIGQNVIGGIIDEVNFMAVIQKSTNSLDGNTTYDQAQAVYDSIRRRRESRFMQEGGSLPGLLFLVSSKRYPGQFTDRKSDEARRELQATGKTRIFIYDKKIWDVQPHKFKGMPRFKVFKGDMTRQPYIMQPGEQLDAEDMKLILEVPEFYRGSFEMDILGSLRDVGGESTMALHPFILDTKKMAAAFGKVPSILSQARCDFKVTHLEILLDNIQNPKEPRFVHIDLALSGDSAGVACGYISGFTKVSRGDGVYEVLPIIVYDFVLEVAPPRGEEIIFSKIRTLIVKLREQGLNIKWVTLDSFQSRDTIQILRTAGFSTGLQSMDITPMPYTLLKTGFYDERILAPKHDRAQSEMSRLEQDEKTGKIDHPPNGSKDCSDAMAGVAFGLIMRRELWARWGVLALMPKEFVTPPKEIDKAPTGTAMVTIE